MTKTAEIIAKQADALGVCVGTTVLVHSSLKSLGAGVTPADVIDGLMLAIGKEGTLVLPALSYLNCNAKKPYFDYYETQSNIGALPEYFRTSVPGVVRSVNPTHSCCALGRNAEYITEGHRYDRTPCGPNSPFRRLYELNGMILFIGCGMRPNTSMHAVEELSVPDYLFGDEVEYTVSDRDGKKFILRCASHNFAGVAQRYERLANLLDDNEMKKGSILEANCNAVYTRPMWEKADAEYRTDQHYFIDRQG